MDYLIEKKDDEGRAFPWCIWRLSSVGAKLELITVAHTSWGARRAARKHRKKVIKEDKKYVYTVEY